MIQSLSNKDGNTISRDQASEYSHHVKSAIWGSLLSRILLFGHRGLLVQCLHGASTQRGKPCCPRGARQRHPEIELAGELGPP